MALTVEQQTFLFELYKVLRTAPLSEHGRYRTFETAAVDVQPWHVDSISLRALEHLVATRSAKGLRRAHRLARKDRAMHMFDQNVSMNRDQMLEYFFKHDVVTVVTAEENGIDGDQHWSDVIPVPPENLKGGSYSMYATKADVIWAAGALADYLKAQGEK